MTVTRRPVDAVAFAWMLLLCATWALQQILVKAVAADIAPVFQIGLRSAVSAVLVAALMAYRRTPLQWREHWRPGLAVGLLFGTEYWCVGEALRLTSAAHTVVFLYTAPLWAAIGLHWRLPGERMRAVQWLGIVLAFVGVARAFLGEGSAAPGVSTWQGDLLALAGGIGWGLTTVVLRGSSLNRAPASETLLYQLLGAAVLLITVAALTGQTGVVPSARAIGSLAFQAVLVSFASFLVWFWLLGRYVAATLGVFTFMTPVIGVGLGAWLLNEPLEPRFVQGALLVLAGVLLVSAHGLLSSWTRRRNAPAPLG